METGWWTILSQIGFLPNNSVWKGKLENFAGIHLEKILTNWDWFGIKLLTGFGKLVNCQSFLPPLFLVHKASLYFALLFFFLVSFLLAKLFFLYFCQKKKNKNKENLEKHPLNPFWSLITWERRHLVFFGKLNFHQVHFNFISSLSLDPNRDMWLVDPKKKDFPVDWVQTLDCV